MMSPPFDRVGAAGCIGLTAPSLPKGLPSLRLAAGRLMEFADDAKTLAPPNSVAIRADAGPTLRLKRAR